MSGPAAGVEGVTAGAGYTVVWLEHPASDLRGKPCSRSYQDAAGQHAQSILAKSHVLDVRLYLQPQRAAFPCVLGAVVVGGRCC
jgi:hypothetical protein